MNAMQYRSPMTLGEAMQGLSFDAVLTRALEVQDALTLRAQAIREMKAVHSSVTRSCATLRSERQ
jgi:hypothetical protein